MKMHPINIIVGIPDRMEEIARSLGMAQTLDPGPGYIEAVCPECGEKMWVGPHQKARLEAAPDQYLIMCIMCAVTSTYPISIYGLGNPLSARIRDI